MATAIRSRARSVWSALRAFWRQSRSEFRGGLTPWSVSALVVVAFTTLPLLVIARGVFEPRTEIWQHLASTVLPVYVANSALLVVGVGALALVLGAGAGLARVGLRIPGTAHLRVEPGPAAGHPHLHHRVHLRRRLRVRKRHVWRAGCSLARGRDVAYPIGDHVPRGCHGHDGPGALPVCVRHRPRLLRPTVGSRPGDRSRSWAGTVEHLLQGSPSHVTSGGRGRVDARAHGGAQRIRSREVLRGAHLHDGGSSEPGSQ